MSFKVLQRKWSFLLPSGNVTGLATFENKALVISANTPAGLKNTAPQKMKDINDLYEAESTFKKSFNKDTLAKGFFINGANCIFDGKIGSTSYRCTLQAVIPAGRAIALEATTSCLVSAIDTNGVAICSNVPIEVPYHHYNASLNKVESVIKQYLSKKK